MSIINLSGTSMMYGQIEWWVDSQDIASNTSRVVAHTLVRKSSQYTGTTGTFTGYVSVGGERSDGTYYGEVASDWVEVAYIAKTVQHDSAGNASVYIEGEVKGPSGTSLSGHKASGGETVTLPTIPRQASLTSAQDFTDESNPTIGYSNPAGNGVNSLQAGIYSANGSTAYAAYRNVSKTGNSYTFNLTEAERNALRNAFPTANSMQVRFYLRCVIGSATYLSYLTKSITIVNGNPKFNPVLEETNPQVLPLTGDGNKLIRFVSVVKATSNAYAVKGASLASQTIRNGSVEYAGSPAVFDKIEAADFVFGANDSRGFYGSQTVTRDMVDYVPLTCNIGSNSPDTEGNFVFIVSGNYFSGNFGAQENSLQVEYRYKAGTGQYSDWTPMSPVISVNTYEATAEFSGFDYRMTYTFQAKATDKIGEVYTVEKPIRAQPVFDWSENDFQFHVPVGMNGLRITELGSIESATDAMSFDAAYPVGSLYISGTDESPEKYGGTWQKEQGRLMLAIGDELTGELYFNPIDSSVWRRTE